MTDKIIPVYKDGKLFSVKSNKTIPIYKNGAGIHEVLDQLHRQAIELENCGVAKSVNAIVCWTNKTGGSTPPSAAILFL